MGSEIFHALRRRCTTPATTPMSATRAASPPTSPSADEALDFIMKAGEAAGYRAGRGLQPGLDPAATEFFKDGSYASTARARPSTPADGRLPGRSGRPLSRSSRSRTAAPRTTWDGWKLLTGELGDKVQLVGDDLFVTNPSGWRWASSSGIANAILIKVNQIGTLTETLDAVEMAHTRRLQRGDEPPLGRDRGHHHRRPRRRHHCGQIKTGSLSRSDRLAKYNQLLRIEEQLGDQAIYAGAIGAEAAVSRPWTAWFKPIAERAGASMIRVRARLRIAMRVAAAYPRPAVRSRWPAYFATIWSTAIVGFSIWSRMTEVRGCETAECRRWRERAGAGAEGSDGHALGPIAATSGPACRLLASRPNQWSDHDHAAPDRSLKACVVDPAEVDRFGIAPTV